MLRYLKSIFMYSFKEELQLYLLVVFPRIYRELAVVLLGPNYQGNKSMPGTRNNKACYLLQWTKTTYSLLRGNFDFLCTCALHTAINR
jgi:hypothetical protein